MLQLLASCLPPWSLWNLRCLCCLGTQTIIDLYYWQCLNSWVILSIHGYLHSEPLSSICFGPGSIYLQLFRWSDSFIQLRSANRSARCFRWPCGCLEHAKWFPSVGLSRPLEPGGLGSSGSGRPEQSQVGISDGLMGAAFLIPRCSRSPWCWNMHTYIYFTPILWPSFVGVAHGIWGYP